MERVRICLHGSSRGVRNCSSPQKPQLARKARRDRYPKTLLAFTRGKGNREAGTEPNFIRSVPEKDRNRLRFFFRNGSGTNGTDKIRSSFTGAVRRDLINPCLQLSCPNYLIAHARVLTADGGRRTLGTGHRLTPFIPYQYVI